MGGQAGEAPRYEVLRQRRVSEKLRALRADRAEERELLFAVLELAEQMSADPYLGQPLAGALGEALGPLDRVWRVGFDISTWPGRPRYVLHYLPPNLSHPERVIWLGIERS